MTENLKQLISLVDLSNSFTSVQRAIYKPWTERMENDAEHSYQIAFLARQLNDMMWLWLDNWRLTQYALAHDIVEVYAWDTDAMGTAWDPTTKAQREHDAFLRLKDEYGSFASFVAILDAYEHQADEEARFVYALDKIVPMLNIYLDNGRDWKRKNKSLADIREYKDTKVAKHPVIEKLYFELLSELESNYTTYFPR